jgi:ORF6N domain
VKKRRRLRRVVPLPVDRTILIVRGHSVVLDVDLAALYGVTTKALNQAVKRNVRRFPSDFRLQLTTSERHEVVTNCDRLRNLKFSSAMPWAFTEHGALMAASVINSARAVRMSIFVIRAFVRLRDIGRRHAQLAAQLDALEQRVSGHDHDLEHMLAALRELIDTPRKPRRRIGFGQPSGALSTEYSTIIDARNPIQRSVKLPRGRIRQHA